MISKRLFSTTCLLFAMLFTFGCQKSDNAAETKDSKDDAVIATYKGGEIKASFINAFLATLPADQKAQLLNPEQKERFLNQIVEFTALAHAAKEAGMDKDPGVKALLDFNINALYAQQYFQKKILPMTKNLNFSDEELKKNYDANISTYMDGQIKASHILVDGEADANDIYSQLKANPAKFAELAKAKSKDTGSAVNGGDLGFFGPGRMVPEFEKVAFATEKGQISKPFKTMFGWHIVRVDEKAELKAKPFAEVKDQIKEKLTSEKSQEIVEKAIKDIKDKMELKVDTKNFAKVGENLAPGPDSLPQVPGGTPPAPPSPNQMPVK